MKRLTFFLFLFPFALSGQVVKDTIITIQDTLIYRETTTREGLNQTVRRVYIGATQEAAVANILSSVENDIRNYARQAAVFANRQIRNEITPTQILLNAYTGRTWFQDMAARHGSVIAGTYRYRKNGASETQVTLSRPTTTSLRMVHNATNYTVRAVGREWIVILNFDGQAQIEMFWDGPNARYIDITNTYELRRL